MSPDEQDGDRGNAHLSVGAPHGGSTADLHRADPAVVDADLLFHAEFKRVGDDLKLVGSDGRTHVVAGYFETDIPHALSTPDGAALSGDVVAALAGPAHPGQYAAADTPQGVAQVIGHAARIEGYVSVVRNGVAITLNNGDVLLKGDVVQTDGEGVAGLVFNDGSAFQIGHDSRVVLSEFSYDSHGAANLELFNLVQGSFSFASGNIAHSGDMRIGTPAGTARITGSAGGGEIGANDGAVSLSIFHQDDGLHQATAFDRDGNPIATISSDGGRLTLTQNGASQLIVDEQTKTDADMAAEFDALTDILKLKGSGSVTPGALGVHGSSSPPSDFHDLGFGSLGFKPEGPGHNPFDNFVRFDGLFHPGNGNDGVAGLPASIALLFIDPPPVISSGATADVNEGVAAHTAVYKAVAADAIRATMTYSLVRGLQDDANAFSIDASTGVVTINATPDFETKPSYHFTVEASDPFGVSSTKAVTLSIDDLAPVIRSGATAAVNEAVAAHSAVYAAVAADPVGGTVTYSLVSGLHDDASAFTINASTGVVTINNVPDFETKPSYAFTVKASDSSGAFTTEAVTLGIHDLPPVIGSGTVAAAIDEAVAAHAVVYTAVAVDPAGGTVTYSLVPGLSDDAAFSIDTSTGVVTINNVPNFEAQPSYAFTVKASDPSGNFTTQTVTLDINDLPPVISSSATAAVDEAVAAHSTVYTAIAADPAGGTVTYSLVSGLNDDAAAFSINASTGVVTINNVPDFEAKSSYDFTVKASDPSGDFTTQAVTLAINDLPPVINSGPSASVDEAVPAQTAVYTAIAADPAGGIVTWSLVSGLNDDAAAFSIDASTGIVTINGVPDFEAQPSYTFTIEASDDSGKSTVEVVTLSINDLPPVIGSGAVATAIDEATAAHTAVYTAVAADPAGGTVTYSLVTGLNDDAAAFSIDLSSGVVTINNVPDFETKPSYTFTVEATDPSGKSTVEAVTLSINDLPPVISSGALATAIDEGSAAGTPVYTATATDPAGGSVTYALVLGLNDDAADFTIDATGVVTINDVADFETKPSYTFTVQATDYFGKSTVEAVTLSINDLPPVISSGAVAAAIDEGSAAGTRVYTASAADPVGGAVTYSLVRGANDDAAFSIDATSGVMTLNAIPDFEAKPSYTFTVKASDISGQASTQTVTLDINDLPPVISSGTVATAINEGVLANTAVYTATAADPAGGIVTYSLVTGVNDDAAFSIDPSTGVVKINAIPDFETQSSYRFTVQASDASGHATTQTITLAVNDLPPVISSAGTTAVNEGVPALSAVYTATAADPGGGSVTYSLVSGLQDDATAFSIDASTGVVTIKAIPDFETKPSYSFTVQASDASGHASTQTVTLDITDLPPVISSGTVAAAITEGAAAHTPVYTAAAADPAGGAVTYSLATSVNDNAAFSINATSGVVTLNAIPDFEAKPSYTFTVTASDASGHASTQTVTLDINDLPPVINSGTVATAINEGVAANTAVYTASAADPVGGAVTYSLVPGVNDDAAFSINASTGVVTINAIPDFETKPSYSFTVKASDASGRSSTQTVTLGINDLPPVISGDLAVSFYQGAAGTVTTADFTAVDPGGGNPTFHVTGAVHGHLEFSGAPGTAITSFTEAQLAAGAVLFVSDGSATASFTVTATNGALTSAPVTVNAAVSSDLVLPGSINLSGITETIHSLTQSGATLSGSGVLTDAGFASFTGGTEDGGGTTIVKGATTLFSAGHQDFTLDNRTLELAGSGLLGAFADDTLHLDNGARFIIDAGATFTDASAGGTFNIASSSGTGSITVAGSYLKTGSGTTDIAEDVTNSGIIDDQSGTLDIVGNVINNGALKAEGGGSLILEGAVTGTGVVSVGNNGSVEFGSSVSAGQTVSFNGTPGIVKIDDMAHFAGTFANFNGTTDAIDLVGLDPGFFDTVFFANGVLTLGGGNGTYNIHISGPTFGFNVGYDSAGTGTLITPANILVVHNATELNAALLAVSVGGSAAGNAHNAIQFANDISIATLGTNLAAINIANGSDLVINGAGFTLDGSNTFRGLFAFGGTVTIQDLNIANARATGGNGGNAGGGGGAGLGGGLFIGATAKVSLDGVNFTGDSAFGGNGGASTSNGNNFTTGVFGGGGGGMGTSGSSGNITQYVTKFAKTYTYQIFQGADTTTHPDVVATVYGGQAGGTLGLNVPGHGSYATTAKGSEPQSTGYLVRNYQGHIGSHHGVPAGFGVNNAAQNGGFGQGGGAGLIGRYYGTYTTTSGGNGGFGGGGGGAGETQNGAGGVGGAGGFGGGGGRGTTGGAGGFGAGNGGGAFGGGGGGLGAGGAIFVQLGGSLTIAGGSLSNGYAAGGQPGSNQGESGGLGLGAGIFIQGDGNIITLAPGAGESLTIANTIADQRGSGGTGANAGMGIITIGGAGVVHFTAANTYSLTSINAGATLDIDSGGSIRGAHDLGTLNINTATSLVDGVDGTGNIALNTNGTVAIAAIFNTGLFTFGSGYNTTAVITSGTISKTIMGFSAGDAVDLRSVAATAFSLDANNVLTLKNSGGTTVGTLNFDPAQTNMHFGLLSDGLGGTLVDSIQTAFPVATATDLNTALAAVSLNGAAYSLASTAYTVTFTGNISLSQLAGQLGTINLNAGSTLLIDGAGFTLDGANNHNGFIDNSTSVTLKDLSIAHTPGYGLFIEGNHSLTLSTSAGQVSTIAGVIADGGSGNSGAVVIGGGTVNFTAANTYTGGTTVASGAVLELSNGGSIGGVTTVNAGGTLDLAGGSVKAIVDNGNIEIAGTAAAIGGAVTGSGRITFDQPETVLKIASGVPNTTFFGMTDGDVIDLVGVTATGITSLGGNNYALIASGGATLGTLHFDPSQNLASDAPVIVADGAGGTAVRLHNIPVFTAATAAQLAAIITEIDSGGVYSLANASYEIDLTGAIALTANLPAINLASGATLSIVGNGYTVSGALNGAATFSAFNLQSGSLSLSNLTISQTKGTGSGLDVASGTSATLSNVTFSGNQAPGSVGGAIFVDSGGSLTVGAGTFSGDTANAGSAIYLNGGTVTFAPPTGQTLTVANSIGGSGTIDISGAGSVVLSGGFDSGNQAIDISGSVNVTLSGALYGNQTLTDTGSGTLTIQPVYNVASSGALQAAVHAVASNAINSFGPINYTINLTADATADSVLTAFALTPGATLTVNTNGHLYDGFTSTASLTYATTGAGGSTELTGGAELSFNVASASDLQVGLSVMGVGRFLSSADTSYVFHLTADVPLAAGLLPVTLASGSTLTIDTNGHLLDGATNATGANFTYAAGPGGSTVLTGNAVPTFNVASSSDLTNAINAIDVGNLFSSPNTNYVFNMTGDVALTSLPAVNLAAGDTLTVNLAGHVFDGAASAGNTLVFSAPAGGGSTTLTGNPMPTFSVGSASAFASVLGVIDVGGYFSSVNTDYVINLTGDVPLTALPAVNLAAGDTLTINLAGHAFDGATSAGGSFVFSAPAGGGGTTLIGNPVPTFSVGSASALAGVLGVIDVGGYLSSVHTDYVINLTGDVPFTAGLPAVNLAAGDTLTVNLAGHAFDGATSAGNTLFFSAPAGGGSTTLTGNPVPTFAVATASDLAAVLNEIDIGGELSFAGMAYVINMTGDVPFTAGLPAVNLAAGDTLTVNLAGHAFDGATSAGDTLVFSAPAGGGATTLVNDPTLTFSVGTAAEFASVLGTIDAGGYFSFANADYVINVTGDVGLTAGIATPNLAAGDTLKINLAGHAFDGATSAGGTFLFSAPAGGGVATLIDDPVPTFSVASASDLANALSSMSNGSGLFASANTDYVINLATDIARDTSIPSGYLAPNDTLTVNLNGHTYQGATNGSGSSFTFVSNPLGGAAVFAGHAVPTFSAASASAVATALNAIDVGGFFSAINTNYVINLTGDSAPGASLPAVNLAAGDTLTVNLAGHAFDGATSASGTLVYSATSGGGTTLTGSPVLSFNVATASDLVATLNEIDIGGLLSAANATYVINMTGDALLTSGLPSVHLAAGDTLTINGAGHSIDGSNANSGLYLQSGAVSISNLTIKNTIERGGAGGNGNYAGAGGGGVGAGGGLFVGSAASATLANVIVTGDTAIGGFGGSTSNNFSGTVVGAGGTLDGRSAYGFGQGGRGTSGRFPDYTGGSGGLGGGGGGSTGFSYSVHGGTPGGPGGYGAGNGGAGFIPNGAGGFFGGGGGGGGAGLGGGIFVAPGGSLTIEAGSVSGNSVVGGNHGNGASPGLAIGAGLFTYSQTVNLAPAQGETLTISDAIAGGGGGRIHIAGPGNVVLSGPITGTTIDISSTGSVSLPATEFTNDSFSVSGSAHFTLVNTITGNGTLSASGSAVLTVTGINLLTGGIVLDGAGTIDLDVANAAGSGIITFKPGADATLIIEAGDTPSNQINGFNPGNTIEFVGFDANSAIVTRGSHNVVTVSDSSGHTADLHFNPNADMSSLHFALTATSGGVLLTDTSSIPLAITSLVAQPSIGTGADLRGTATPGSTISIVANGGTIVLGTGVADDSGNFDITTSALAEGIYSFQAISRAGASTQTSANFVVNVLPNAPVITTLIANHPLNGDTVELKGTGEANQIIKLYLDGSSTVLATTTTDGDGNFDVFTPALADGAHTVRATETDSFGLTSALSAGFAVNVSPTAPTLSAVVGNPFNGGSIEVKGTGEANRTIEIFADGTTTMIGSGSTNGSGQFDFFTFAGVTDGVHTLTAVTFDPPNLVSTASNTVTFNVNPSAPAITTLVAQPVNGDTIHVKGTGEPNLAFTLYADGGTTPVGSGTIGADGHFDITTTVAFADGVHHLTVTATNSLNFTSPVSSQFTVNVVPVTPVIDSVVAVAGTTQQIEVQGTAEANQLVKLFADGSGTVLASQDADSSGHFDIFANILGGTHTIVATETDAANLTSAASSAVSVNVTPKAPVITTVVGQPLNGDKVSVTGTAQHPGGTITLYADGGSTAVGSGTITGTTFAFTTSATFADGIHTLTAVETDNGISSGASVAFTVNVDPTAPTNLAQVGTTTQGGMVEVTGTGEAGETVTLSIGGVTVGTGLVDAQTGHFDIMVAGLNPGIVSVSAIETDADHLSSTASQLNVTVVPVAPVLTSAVSVDDANGQVKVTGTGGPGMGITLYADGTTLIGSGTVDQSGNFTIYSSNGVALGSGPHDFTATETVTNGLGSVTSVASAPVHASVTTVADVWTIASGNDLANAIAAIDLTGASSRPNAHYTFNIVGDLQLTGQLPAFNLASGDALKIQGNGHTLDAHGLPGLFVYAGNVEIDDLSIINATTVGGAGFGGGGGGAGLGGGLFIASAGAVTLDNVSFASNQAIGGGSAYGGVSAGGGGGGLGGAGGYGGGGIGLGARGGDYRPGGQGIVIGAASGAGGGGAAPDPVFGNGQALSGGGGGGIGGSPGSASAGGDGGFGGGGGGGFYDRYGGVLVANGGDGGFGGGGGSGHGGYGSLGGVGGFGGGSGVSVVAHPVYVRTAGIVAGGFGAGASYSYSGYGGAGLGAGGAVFVQQGGSLTFAGSGGVSNNQVVAGNDHAYLAAPVSNGSGLGSGLFLQGQQSVTFAPGTGKTITISDAIADMTGSNDHTLQLGAGSLVVNGQGTLVLSGDNTFTGGIRLETGTLDVVGAGAGFGAIELVNAAQATLAIDVANGALKNAIVIDNFQATNETFVNGVLTLTDAGGSSVHIDVSNAGTNFADDLHVTLDPVHGTTTITGAAAAWSNVNGGDWDSSANWSSTAIPTSANDVTIATGASTPYTVSIVHGALFTPGIVPLSAAFPDFPFPLPNIPVTVATVVPAEAEAQAHNLTVNDAHATIDDTGILMLSGGLTLTAGTFHLDGGSLQTALSIDVASGATFGGYGLVSVGGSVSGAVVASASGQTLDFISDVTGTGDFHVNAGATLEFGGSVASGTTITFDGGTGTLKLDAPESFAGTIAGFTGTAADAAHSDVIDLAGIDGNHLTQSGYDQNSGVLTVSDGTNTAHLIFSNFNSSFSFASDGNGGTLVYDPPALPQSTPPNPSAPAGAPALVALGDNFVFQPATGAKTIGNFDAQHDTIELDHFAAAQTAGQLAALVSADDHNNALITLGHDDSVTITGMNPQQLLAVLSTSVHLH